MSKTVETPAIRTVSEDDDTHVIEMRLAYGGPFRGKDSYQTYFSARTDWGLDLHPEGVPVLFNHGFDPDFGLTPIGRTSPTATFRSEADGMWVQAQLDKRNAYYATRVRPLLDANGLGASQGSAEHSVRIDARTGEVQQWPLQEVSLTPTEANPWNTIAARSAETAKLLIVAEPEAVRAIQTFADIIAAAEISEELPEAFDTLTSAIYSAIYATDADFNPVPPEEKRTAIQTSLDQFRDHILAVMDKTTARTGEPTVPVGTAYRASKRSQSLIDDIHDRAVRLGASAHQGPDDAQPNDDSPPAESNDDAARSGDTVPRLLLIREPADPAAVRADIASTASAIGARIAADFRRG